MTGKNLKIKILTVGFMLLFGFQSASAQPNKFETRCGWFQNPTPANYSLYNKDNEWFIGVQGDHQVKNFQIPAFKRGQWMNFFERSYGYGCACFQMTVDKETQNVLEIKKSYSKPLSACRKDKALKKRWNFEL